MLSIGKLASGQADYYLALAGARVDRGSTVSSGGDAAVTEQLAHLRLLLDCGGLGTRTHSTGNQGRLRPGSGADSVRVSHILRRRCPRSRDDDLEPGGAGGRRARTSGPRSP